MASPRKGTDVDLPPVPPKKEHYATRYKREIAEQKSEVERLLQFIEVNHLSEKLQDYKASSSTVAGVSSSQETDEQGDHDGDDGGDDGDDDGSSGDEPSEEPHEEDTRMIDIFIRKGFDRTSSTRWTKFSVSLNWTTDSLAFMVYQKWQVKPSDQKLLLNDEVMSFDKSISENGLKDKDQLLLLLTIKGGVLRRQHVDKAQAMTAVKKKIEKNYKGDTATSSTVSDSDFPPSFLAFVNEHSQKVQEFKALKASIGGQFVATCMRNLSTTNLEFLQKVFKNTPGSKKLSNEEKAVRAFQVLFPSLTVLEKCQSKMSEMESDVIVQLLHWFVDEFHQFNEQSGQLSIDGSLFLKKIDAELESRHNQVSVNVNSEAVAGNCNLQ